MPRIRPKSCRFLPLFALAMSAPAVGADDNGRWFSQKPEVAASRVRGEKAVPVEPATESARLALKQGPAPVWIWGADPGRRYFLRTEFPGGSRAAWLRASCDNRMTLFLNGRRVASADDWQKPLEVDVQGALLPGKNVLAVEAVNEGGPSGLALKLALTMPDGSIRYVVSDASWKAAERRNAAAASWKAVTTGGAMGAQPWGDVFAREPVLAEVPRDTFELLPGFRAERLFTVPREELGSWVSITFDDKGRLLASDERGKGLCRITPPPVGSDQPTKVEHLDVKITDAQGMLCAFGSLYLSINGGPGSGLYRLRDTDGDDRYDKVEKLKDLRGAGEHGPHALRLGPDGKSLYIVSGNHTLPPEHLNASRLPMNWGEDLLLPRQWDANGHARGILAPGGWIARTDPDGKTWELVSSGYRNSYDMAFNADGELFAYDSDMEWDIGMPWYRPTRATHATSGSEFGWRSGTGKWPAYYVDSLPSLFDIGPGSPVGVTFGYGAKFPAQYQKALYLCDWTFGTIYALHLEPQGATYKAVKEEFLSRTPLPLTDAAVGPDGALYFTIGGRGTQSELFRVTYTGSEPTAPADAHDADGAELRALRHKLEQYHRRAEAPEEAVALAYPNLKHPDRFIRYAARLALEHQPVAHWQARVLGERDPEALITGAVALARQGEKSLQPKLLGALDRLDFAALPESQKLGLLRAWSLAFIRMGEPGAATAARLAKKLDAFYPAPSDPLNRELVQLLVYLKSPTVVSKTIALLKRPDARQESDLSDLIARNASYGGPIAKMIATQPDRQKLHYAFVLRNARTGWTLDERKFYFRWLDHARGWSGGASFQGFLTNMDKDAYENMTDAERLAVESSGARKPLIPRELPKPKGPGRTWTLDAVLALEQAPTPGRNFDRGRTMFAAARCVLCHRFAGEGGATGPDLTQAAGRFTYKDLAEAIVLPSKVISDQYRAVTVATTTGQIYTGRVVGETPKSLSILTDPEDPTKVTDVPKDEVDEMKPSPLSLMPEKLLDTLNPQEVRDLLAYLLSRGDPNDPMFRRK